MPSYTLYHANPPPGRVHPTPDLLAAWPEDYRKVADIDAETLEAIPSSSFENLRVQGPFRSTSVGDVAVDEAGIVWIRASRRWEILPPCNASLDAKPCERRGPHLHHRTSDGQAWGPGGGGGGLFVFFAPPTAASTIAPSSLPKR